MLAFKQFDNHLNKEFIKHVAFSEDEEFRSQYDKELLCKTKAMVGFYLRNVAACSDDNIIKHTFDGNINNGIDGLYYDPLGKRLHIIQAKWIISENRGVVYNDVYKLISYTRELLTLQYDKFNSVISEIKNDINAALLDADTQITMAILTTSHHSMSKETQKSIDYFLEEQNIIHKFLSFEYYGIKRLHALLIT